VLWPCGAGYTARGPAFQRVQPPERRLQARLPAPLSFAITPQEFQTQTTRASAPLACKSIGGKVGRMRSSAGWLGLALCLAGVPGIAIEAADGGPQELILTVGKGAVIDCPEGVARIATSNPDAVDAVMASDKKVLFQAKALGQATLVILVENGRAAVLRT